MNERLKAYQSWYLENKTFFESLKSHNSVLYTRLYPVYDVLRYLYEEHQDEKYLDEDIDKIIQVGLEFIHQQIFTCKTYYQEFFNQDFHAFLEYDQVINYLLFIEDLKYELAEKDIEYAEEELDQIVDELEGIISDKKDVPENLNLYIDRKIADIVSFGQDDFHSIIDIFIEIGDTLGLSFEDEEDIVIGKEL